MKSWKEKIGKKKRLENKGGKKRQLQLHQWTKNQESTSSPSSTFKHKQTKFRSLKKTDKALSNSFHKRNEIVQSLAKKYDIRKQLQEPTLKGKKPISLAEEEEQ